MCLGSACDCFEVQIDDADNFFWSLQYKFGDECPSNYCCDKCVIEMPTGTLRVNDSEIVGRERFSEEKCSLAFRWTIKVNTLLACDQTLQGIAREINSLAIQVDFLPAVDPAGT